MRILPAQRDAIEVPRNVQIPRAGMETRYSSRAGAGGGAEEARCGADSSVLAHIRAKANRRTGAPDEPATGVSWHEAMAFADWAGLQLPTNSQWEKAARGTDGRTYPWGDDFRSAVYTTNRDELSWGAPGCESVYGVHGMAGGVFEWVQDDDVAPGDEWAELVDTLVQEKQPSSGWLSLW